MAFSGGVDSAYLAWAATQVLGPAALCVTADSPSYPDHHRQLALRIAREFGLRHEIIHTAELERPEYRANPVEPLLLLQARALHRRCRASRGRAASPSIVDGSNADDRGDYRPGRQAAREFGVRSPLDEADLTKAEIRELSRARRPADVGRAGVGLPVVAHSVPLRSDRREAADDRARRRPCCATSDSASAACGITTRSPGSRSAPTSCRVRSSRTSASGSFASCAPSATSTSRSTCRGIGWAA